MTAVWESVALGGLVLVAYVLGATMSRILSHWPRPPRFQAGTSHPHTTRWRTGRHVGRTLYTVTPAHPDGLLIGVMDTPADAELVVAAVNTYNMHRPHRRDIDDPPQDANTPT